jgi:hypothetical protein
LPQVSQPSQSSSEPQIPNLPQEPLNSLHQQSGSIEPSFNQQAPQNFENPPQPQVRQNEPNQPSSNSQ